MAGISTTRGYPLTTIKHSVANTAEALIDDVTGFVAQSGGYNVTYVKITCETNAIRYGWNITPTVDGGTALGHVLAAAGTLELSNHKEIIGFKFVNKANASVAILHITPYVSIP